MSATRITSATGALYANIGRKKDGTFTVRTYLAGEPDQGDGIETWYQDGFPSKQAALEWAIADMKKDEDHNNWTVGEAA